MVAAVASPYALQTVRAAGVPIPVYITPGQTAALAAFPQIVLGVPTNNPGTNIADTQSFVAKWNALNNAYREQNGSAVMTLYTNPKWNPTNYAKLTGEEATELGKAFIAAADAGEAADSDYKVSATDAYKDLSGLVATSTNWGGADDGDANDMVPVIYALVLEMDGAGYLITGKPFEPTVTGGLAAAASAVEAFVGGVAGKAVGGVAGIAADVLLSTPALILIAGVLVYTVVKGKVAAVA